MPAPYASLGIVGGLLLLGVLVYSIWTQIPTPQVEETRYNFNPGAGYDKPRTWEDEDNQEGSRRRRRRNRVESCIICTEALNETHEKRLECGHTFHHNCILLWFREKKICPTCRRPA